MKKGKKGRKKGRKTGKRGGARGSSAMRGATRRVLSMVHVGVDLKTYPEARALSFRVKKELELEKVPEIRKIERRKPKRGQQKIVYAVAVPITNSRGELQKIFRAASSKKAKKKGGKR